MQKTKKIFSERFKALLKSKNNYDQGELSDIVTVSFSNRFFTGDCCHKGHYLPSVKTACTIKKYRNDRNDESD